MSILQKHLDNLPNTLLEIKAKKIMFLQESVSKGKVTCDDCGWKWSLSDGGEDPYLCHECGCDNTPGKVQEGRPPKKYKGDKQMMLYREIDKVFDKLLAGKEFYKVAEMYKNILNQMGANTLDPDTTAYKYLNSDKYAKSIISSYIAKQIQAITPSPFGIPEDNLFDMIRDEVKGHSYRFYLQQAVDKLSKAVEKDFIDFKQDEEEPEEDDGIIRDN